MGEKPVEDAKRKHGEYRVEGVLFTLPSKLVLATEIKQIFEDRKIRIPLGDGDLRNDLHKVQRITSETGAPRFVAERDGAGHADRFWGLALAIHAASNPAAPIQFEAAPTKHDRWNESSQDNGWHGQQSSEIDDAAPYDVEGAW